MIKEKKTVAIILPTADRAFMLDQALESIKEQTYKNYRVYISDGGTEAATSRVIDRFAEVMKIRSYLRRPSDSVARACNDLIAASKKDHADYIQIMHDDDLLEPTMLSQEVAVLEENWKLDWVYTWGRTFGESDIPVQVNKMPTLKDMVEKNHFHHWLMGRIGLFQKEQFRTVPWPDWDLWLRIFKGHYRGKIIKRELYLYRDYLHIQDLKKSKEHYEQILKLNGLWEGAH